MAYTDRCVSIKDSSFPVWLNPNILLTGPISGAYKADPPPDQNDLGVNVHLLTECKLEDPDDPIRVEVWSSPLNAAPPSVSLYSRIASGTLSGQALADLIANGSKQRDFNWVVDLTDPNQAPGHHCLRARVFPSSNTPPAQFDQTHNEQHEGQHNICIVPCESPCGQDQEILLWTIQEEVEIMTLLVLADLEPDEGTMLALRQVMANVPGFEGIRYEAPPRFEIDTGPGDVQDLRENIEPGPDGTFGGHPFPNIEIDFALQPGEPVPIRFLTDLEEVEPGQAHVFHLTHLDQKERQVQGGLTLLALRQDPSRAGA